MLPFRMTLLSCTKHKGDALKVHTKLTERVHVVSWALPAYLGQLRPQLLKQVDSSHKPSPGSTLTV